MGRGCLTYGYDVKVLKKVQFGYLPLTITFYPMVALKIEGQGPN